MLEELFKGYKRAYAKRIIEEMDDSNCHEKENIYTGVRRMMKIALSTIDDSEADAWRKRMTEARREIRNELLED